MSFYKVKPTLMQDIGAGTRERKRKFSQIDSVKRRDNRDTGRVCGCCLTEVSSRHNQCSKSHLLCESCLKVAIRTSISTDQTSLTCPVRGCQAEILLHKSESSFCVTLFRAHAQRIVLKAIKPVTQTKAAPKPAEVVSCPFCKTSARLSDAAVVLKCSKTRCQEVVCRFCLKISKGHSQRKHVGCQLLKFPGSTCWTDLSRLPVNWSKFEDSEYKKSSGYLNVLVPLDSEEGSSVVNFYRLSSSRKVKEVCRIQSPHLWQRYALKKKNMLTELAAEDLHERPLFHGTSQHNKNKILTEGFDCRKGKASGLCGKGTYFSPFAKYSETYSDDKKLFVAYVLCGKSTSSQGHREYPIRDKDGRTYDSIVDYHRDPEMYVVFCSSQCYPAYLVTLK